MVDVSREFLILQNKSVSIRSQLIESVSSDVRYEGLTCKCGRGVQCCLLEDGGDRSELNGKELGYQTTLGGDSLPSLFSNCEYQA
jgi:hypothetical protein